jgi:hypothetical protein
MVYYMHEQTKFLNTKARYSKAIACICLLLVMIVEKQICQYFHPLA